MWLTRWSYRHLEEMMEERGVSVDAGRIPAQPVRVVEQHECVPDCAGLLAARGNPEAGTPLFHAWSTLFGLKIRRA
jgi:hypothetical protein